MGALLKNRAATSAKPAAKGKFQYKRRTPEEVAQRASRAIGGRDGPFVSDVQFYVPTTGDNNVRILPPPPEKDGYQKVKHGRGNDVGHYGLGIFVHYGIGPDRNAYLCRNKMLGEECVLCEERARASGASEEELAKDLKPAERVAMWVIDRAHESKGPLIWSVSAGQDKDICKILVDKATGEAISPDDPEEGYDLGFTAEGENIKRKLKSYAFSRRPSPLSDDPDKMDKWLKFVVENPIDEKLEFFDNDHMAKSYEGHTVRREDDDKNADKGKDSSRPTEREERPAASRPVLRKRGSEEKQPEPEPEQSDGEKPSWDELEAMDDDQLAEVGEAFNIDFPSASFDTVEEIRDYVAEQLGVEKPQAEPPKSAGGWRDRLKNLGGKK